MLQSYKKNDIKILSGSHQNVGRPSTKRKTFVIATTDVRHETPLTRVRAFTYVFKSCFMFHFLLQPLCECGF